MANEHYKQLSELRTMVRDRLDEVSPSFWSNAQLNRYLNQAKDRAVNRVKALNDDYFDVTRTGNDGALTILGESYNASNLVVPVGSSTDLVLPPDFQELRAIEVITSGFEYVKFIYRSLSSPDMRGARELTDSVTPTVLYYSILGEPSLLRYAPKSDTTLTLKLTYVQQIPDMVAESDRLFLQGSLYIAVVEYAVAAALRQDRNSGDAATAKAEADGIIAEMFGAQHRQSQDPDIVPGYLEEG